MNQHNAELLSPINTRA